MPTVIKIQPLPPAPEPGPPPRVRRDSPAGRGMLEAEKAWVASANVQQLLAAFENPAPGLRFEMRRELAGKALQERFPQSFRRWQRSADFPEGGPPGATPLQRCQVREFEVMQWRMFDRDRPLATPEERQAFKEGLAKRCEMFYQQLKRQEEARQEELPALSHRPTRSRHAR
jgi:hypothetical protein